MITEENIGSLWDFNNPELSETKFREALTETSDNNPELQFQLKTQIVRTFSLRRQFDKAHALINELRMELPNRNFRSKCYFYLEEGRTYNSSGVKDKALDCFLLAKENAEQGNIQNLLLDSIHMLGIADKPENQISWNEEALKLAENSSDEKVSAWKGPLYNNLGWSYFDSSNYEKALELFWKGYNYRSEKGQIRETAIARWTIARCLRALKRNQEALDILHTLENETEHADGYVFEELGENYLEIEANVKYPDYFTKAYELLSKDEWMVKNEVKRLNRLRELSATSNNKP